VLASSWSAVHWYLLHWNLTSIKYPVNYLVPDYSYICSRQWVPHRCLGSIGVGMGCPLHIGVEVCRGGTAPSHNFFCLIFGSRNAYFGAFSGPSGEHTAEKTIWAVSLGLQPCLPHWLLVNMSPFDRLFCHCLIHLSWWCIIIHRGKTSGNVCSTGPAPDTQLAYHSSRSSCASGIETSLEKAKVCTLENVGKP